MKSQRMWWLWLCLGATLSSPLGAQTPRHYLTHSRMPPGTIGRTQLAHKTQLRGVFQPVHVRVPGKATVAFAEGNAFEVQEAGDALVSLQVGVPYRLKISNIPLQFGDVYPTIELLDRLHPPPGKETRFPIPLEITQEELRSALAGKFVTRVVYVENPRHALPVRDLPQQRYVDALAHEDPLHLAAGLGRPVAILRMGSLTPAAHGPTDQFLFGAPPLLRHPQPKSRPYVPSQRPVVAEPRQVAPPGDPAELLDVQDAPANDGSEAAPDETPADEAAGGDGAGDLLDDPFVEDET